MRVLAIGDAHASVKNISEIEKLGKKSAKLAVESKVDLIVVLGDLSNDFAKIHVLAMKAMVSFLGHLVDTQVPVVYLPGNHCMLNNRCFMDGDHAFTAFRRWPGLILADKAMKIKDFVICPYTPPGSFKAALETVDGWKSATAIFCHQEFKGAKMGAIESVHGDEWPVDAPLVVSGHIHDYAWLQSNILYVGAPMSQAYGESDAKTVSVLDFDNGKLTQERRVDLGLPKRITVTLSVKEAKAYELPENTHVRINLVGTTEEISAFKKSNKYADLVKVAKVIPKHADKTVVKVAGERKRYLDILKRACATESVAVQAAFTELTQTER